MTYETFNNILFTLGIVFLCLPVATSRHLLTCKVEQDVSTVNNQGGVLYYTCTTPGGAVIPQVMLMVPANSMPHLVLKDLEGQTIDLQIAIP